MNIIKSTYTNYRLRKKLAPYLFLSPAIFFFSIFSVWALGYTLYLSFFRFNLLRLTQGKLFIALDGYISVLKDQLFYTTLWNSFYFTIGNVFVGGALALFLAILVREIYGPFRTAIRTISFLPVITSMVAAAIIWKWLYDPRLGLLNYTLGLFGIPKQGWLTSSALAMPSVIIMNIWKSVGYRMILFLAGLQNIPSSYYEVAQVDGATSWQKFRYVTWPLLRPTTVFVLVTSFIFSFQVFTQVFIMTGGGPGDSTRTIVQYIYDTAFQYYQMGKGAAMSVLMFIIILLLTLFNFKVTKGFESAQ